jgi:hypothetical protein
MKRRITVTLEDEVLQWINEEAVANCRTFDDVLNERLRRSYPAKKSASKIKRFIVRPLNTGGFVPDVDENKLNQLFEALEWEKDQK